MRFLHRVLQARKKIQARPSRKEKKKDIGSQNICWGGLHTYSIRGGDLREPLHRLVCMSFTQKDYEEQRSKFQFFRDRKGAGREGLDLLTFKPLIRFGKNGLPQLKGLSAQGPHPKGCVNKMPTPKTPSHGREKNGQEEKGENSGKAVLVTCREKEFPVGGKGSFLS